MDFEVLSTLPVNFAPLTTFSFASIAKDDRDLVFNFVLVRTLAEGVMDLVFDAIPNLTFITGFEK